MSTFCSMTVQKTKSCEIPHSIGIVGQVSKPPGLGGLLVSIVHDIVRPFFIDCALKRGWPVRSV